MIRTLIILVIITAASFGAYYLHLQSAKKEEIFSAVRNDDVNALKVAIAKKISLDVRDSVGQTPLHSAAYKAAPEIIKLLIEAGPDVNARDEQQGGTPLHWAVINGKVENAKLLLENGANPDIQDEKGMTPMHWAVTALKINNFTKAFNVKLLLDYDANPTIKDARGKTVLDYATEKKNTQMMQILNQQ